MFIPLGIREPEGLIQTMKYLYNEETFMEYEQFKDEFGQLYAAAWHTHVGQVNWYLIDAVTWDELLQDSTEQLGTL